MIITNFASSNFVDIVRVPENEQLESDENPHDLTANSIAIGSCTAYGIITHIFLLISSTCLYHNAPYQSTLALF